MKGNRILVAFLLGCLVSMFIFPFSLSFLPPSLNTKKIIGVVGIIAFAFYSIRTKTFNMSSMVIGSALIAVAFSVWCYFCMVANETDDTTYAEYWVSFATWLGGAYGVVSLIRKYHGSCSLKRITDYMAGVCFAQCWLTLAIDAFPGFQTIVDTFIIQGHEFMQRVNRLYGIGCALDPAGIRFSATLVLIAHQIGNNASVLENKKSIFGYMILYSVITIIGNMISRTTTVGAVMGLVYMFLMIGFPRKGIIDARQARFYSMFFTIVAVAVAVSVLLYRTSPDFRKNIRFAFESFFNFFETGVFRSDSVDKLNSVMWIWPKDFRSWVIGTGLFGNFVYATDIGYCRFTLYCGLIGMVIFSAFFIYNGLVVNRKFRNFTLVSLFIISLTFVIWLKVATDIFYINALLFCIDGDFDADGNEIDWDADETDESETGLTES